MLLHELNNIIRHNQAKAWSKQVLYPAHVIFRYAHLEQHPVDIVAEDIASRTKVLCLDELHVSDVADALILSQVGVSCCSFQHA